MSAQPKWQRARFLPSCENPPVIGACVWVKCERPRLRSLGTPPDRPNGFTSDEPLPALDVNILDSKGLMATYLEDVELLPDFADDVPLVPWEQFLDECRASKEPR